VGVLRITKDYRRAYTTDISTLNSAIAILFQRINYLKDINPGQKKALKNNVFDR